MTEIAMPTSANLVQFSLSLDDRKQVNRSVWTGVRKVTGLPGVQMWKASFSPHVITSDVLKKEWRAFLISLRGPENTFRLKVASGQHGGSNPTVKSGANAGATLPLQGLPISGTLLVAGDYMTVPLPSGHQRLVMLTAPLTSDASGEAVASIWPYLNEVPETDETVETIDPFALMALNAAEQGWQDQFGRMTIAFDAEEAL